MTENQNVIRFKSNKGETLLSNDFFNLKKQRVNES